MKIVVGLVQRWSRYLIMFGIIRLLRLLRSSVFSSSGGEEDGKRIWDRIFSEVYSWYFEQKDQNQNTEGLGSGVLILNQPYDYQYHIENKQKTLRGCKYLNVAIHQKRKFSLNELIQWFERLHSSAIMPVFPTVIDDGWRI